jgi:hypothetical protein
MSHTPTPWHANTHLNVNDLSFMLQAVNAHDELVAALCEAFDYIAAQNDDQELIDSLGAALAKVKS